MSQSMLKAAVSHDESLVAVVVPSSDRGIIQVYRTESGLLQTTLTTRHANNLQANVMDAKKSSSVLLESVLFCGNNHVVARASPSLCIWDLVRGGVVAHSIPDEDGRTYLDAACFDDHLYVLMGTSSSLSKSGRHSSPAKGGSDNDDEPLDSTSRVKLMVIQYDPTSGKQLRKIKCGKSDGSAGEFGLAIMAMDGKLQLVVRSNGLKIIDASTGARIGKHKHDDRNKRHKKDGSGGSGILVCDSMVAMPRLSAVALYNIKTKEWLESVPSSSPPTVHLWPGDDSVLLLVDGTLYACSDTGTQVVRKLKSKHTMALLPGGRSKVTAVLHNPSAKSSLQIQRVDWSLGEKDDMETDELAIEWFTEDTTDQTEVTAHAASKRTSGSLTILGPGQAGGEHANVSERRKKPRAEDSQTDTAKDEDGMSIADRLKKLTQAMEDEDEEDDSDKEALAKPKFAAQKATTESLSQLLGQALKGGDDNLLELALQVRNRTVIQETVAGLEDACVDTLLTKLTIRLASTPNRAQQLANWLSIVLLSGKIRQKDQLQPLRNLIQDRIDALPLLLRLEGRLAAVNTSASAKKQSKRLIV